MAITALNFVGISIPFQEGGNAIPFPCGMIDAADDILQITCLVLCIINIYRKESVLLYILVSAKFVSWKALRQY